MQLIVAPVPSAEQTALAVSVPILESVVVGVPQVPSPRQNVLLDALVPELK